MKEYWFMNSKLQFERHLQFTAVILLQQSHGFLVLIIPCYHAGTIKEANINNRTGRLLTVLLQYFVNVLSMPSSMHHQWIHQCIHQCIINAPSTHSSMYHQCIHYCIYQCILNAASIHHQCIHCIKCINFVHSVLPFIISTSSVRLSMHHQCINQCIHQCIINAIHQCIINPSIMLLKLINNSLRKYKGN